VRRRSLLVAALLPLVLAAPAAAAPGGPVLLHLGQVTRQDLPSRGGSEADTVVEPDVQASPVDPLVAVAAAHDSRFADGGAVGISVAWTRDGGATWRHRPVPGLTTATGGSYSRASDPVVAFGADGTAYLSVLLVDLPGCRSAVAVLRSVDGGATWSPPSYVHRSAVCSVADDKNWVVVDQGARSPHRGRVYQFWTLFLPSGSPQAVRWSDDGARTWSATSYVTPRDHGTQNSQPVVLADGTLLDTYLDFGSGAAPDLAPDAPGARPSVVDATGPIRVSRSTDGGRTWQRLGEVTDRGGGYAQGVRCCLFSAALDAVTQTLHVVWLGGGPGDTDPVLTSASTDGVRWSPPVAVSHGDVAGVQRVNADVVARGGQVYVSFGTRTRVADRGGQVQQQLAVSHDGGRRFGPPLSLGQPSLLRYGAQSRGWFPGDYTGSSLSGDRLYLVWTRASAPPAGSTSPYHQVVDGATLRP
jgi:hypothetical protein